METAITKSLLNVFETRGVAACHWQEEMCDLKSVVGA